MGGDRLVAARVSGFSCCCFCWGGSIDSRECESGCFFPSVLKACCVDKIRD